MNIDREGWMALASEVESQAPLRDSYVHGPHHWRLVAWVGHELLRTEPEADPLVTLLFALFHDSRRENEFDDPQHGPRGADLAGELIPIHIPDLDEHRVESVCRACELHTEAGPTTDVVVGLSWDADRLNLWRVGTTPHPSYLSTTEAKKPERIAWAAELQDRDLTWTEVFGAYTSSF